MRLSAMLAMRNNELVSVGVSRWGESLGSVFLTHSAN